MPPTITMSVNCFSQCNYDHILEQLKDYACQSAFADFNKHFARQIDNGTVNKALGNFYTNEERVFYIPSLVLESWCSSPSTCSQSPTLSRPRMFLSSRCLDLPLKNWSIFSRMKLWHWIKSMRLTNWRKQICMRWVSLIKPYRMAFWLLKQKVIFVKEPLCTSSLDPNDPCDIITDHLPDKYTVGTCSSQYIKFF